MKETEITVELLQGVETVKDLLKQKGFVITRDCLMEDWYFSRNDNSALNSFTYKELMKNSFLIRRLSNPSLCQLIYKNKDVDEKGNVVAEEKVITKLDNAESAIRAMSLAGLTLWCEIKQNMFIFTNGKIEFALQEVVGGKAYIEYEEDSSVCGLDKRAKIEKMLQTLKDLGLRFGSDFSCKKVWLKFKNEMSEK